MSRFWVLVVLLGASLGLGAPTEANTETGEVIVLTVRGVINPVVAGYVDRVVEIAEKSHARALVIRLDTPGGLDSSMRQIVQRLLGTRVPVVVYVAPSGARAASAGVFIAAAAHVAAMSPGTNVGAAHPVAIGGEMDETMDEKATNDAVAYIRGIAEQRNRNGDWLEEAVRRSVSIPDREAVEREVVDLVAESLEDLLGQIHGRTVSTAAGPITLDTRDVAIRHLDMNPIEAVLHVIVDPNVAYLLLTLGFWALIVELITPGGFLAGITGVVCIILALAALASLPMNWAGVLLIALALALFFAELMTPTNGALTVAGLITFVLGSLLLFSPFAPSSPAMPEMAVNRWLVAAVAGLMTAFFVFALSAGLRAQRGQPMMNPQGRLVGAMGLATSSLAPEGTVQAAGELWTARSRDGQVVGAGESVRVVAVEGLRLVVEKIEPDPQSE